MQLCPRKKTTQSPVGILAYGSLISNPGPELGPRIRQVVPRETPFRVEFARKSRKRSWAPTLIPVKSGGAQVQAVLLVLDSSVSTEAATHMLYRREIGKYGKCILYTHRERPDKNHVVIEPLPGDQMASPILYTKIGENIDEMSPTHLANLAIASAQEDAGRCGEDGITYLRNAEIAGIVTPLMSSYKSEILRQTGASTLDDAIDMISNGRSN